MKSIIYLLWMELKMFAKRNVVTSKPALYNFFQDCSLVKMVNLLNEAVVVVDGVGTIEITNSLTSSLLGFEKNALLGMSLFDITCGEVARAHGFINQVLQQEANGVRAHSPFELTLCGADSNTIVNVEMSISLLPKELYSDQPLFICVFRDLTLQHAEIAALETRANTDFLTGLANRHKFAEYFETQWNECQQEQSPISLIFIDVDHFKKFNDEFGHVAGDRFLKRIGETIALTVPDTNSLAVRYGGEEFAIVLPKCSPQTAQLLAIRIKRHISQLSTRHFSLVQEAHITVSIGVASQENGRYEERDALLRAADALLYQAKSQGRDQICFLSS